VANLAPQVRELLLRQAKNEINGKAFAVSSDCPVSCFRFDTIDGSQIAVKNHA
jgi:hypothetical protein